MADEMRRRAARADSADAGGGCKEAHNFASKFLEAGLEDSTPGGGNGRPETIDGGLLDVVPLEAHLRWSARVLARARLDCRLNLLPEARLRAQRDITSRLSHDDPKERT